MRISSLEGQILTLRKELELCQLKNQRPRVQLIRNAFSESGDNANRDGPVEVEQQRAVEATVPGYEDLKTKVMELKKVKLDLEIRLAAGAGRISELDRKISAL